MKCWLMLWCLVPGLAMAQSMPAPQDQPDVQNEIDNARHQADIAYRQAADVMAKITDIHGQIDQLTAELNARMPEYRRAQAEAAAHRAANPAPK